jgi:hypothetical protein
MEVGVGAMTNIQKGDLAALKKKLGELDILACSRPEGGFTAYTVSEPLFCIDRDTIDDLKSAVTEALANYASTFYHIDKKGVSTVSEDPIVARPSVAEEKVRPVSRLRPDFATFDSFGDCCAAV